MEKKAKEEERMKELSHMPNKEMQNKEFYDSYLGYKYIDDMGPKYLRSILRTFIKERKKRISELHSVTRINRYIKSPNADCNIPERMDYLSDMGLGYCCGTRIPIDDGLVIEDVMFPLAQINVNYCSCKIHVIEVELCYINRNIKTINKILRSRERKERLEKHEVL